MIHTATHCAWLRRGGLVALHFLLGLGCSDPEWLDLKVLMAAGPDPLATVDRLRLAVSDPAAEQIFNVQGADTFDLNLEVEVTSQIGMIALEGYAGATLVARGETPPLVLAPVTQQLSLLVAQTGALSPLQASLEHPTKGMMSILIPSMGILLVGGMGTKGEILSSALLYDFFIHNLISIDPLRGGRFAGVSASCGSYCGLVALGESENGLATTIQRWEAGTWSEYNDQLSPSERRRDASIILLEDGISLVVGGEGASGALDTLLKLNPGALYTEPLIELAEPRTREARIRPALAAGPGAVVIVGGQPKGGRPAEIFYISAASAQDLDLEGPRIASGTATSNLADGRVLVIGGRDENGVLLRDAWIINTVSLEVIHLPQALAEGRADHRVLRVGGHLVVIGGVTAAGLAEKAEILQTEGLALVAQPAMQVPRTGFVAERLGVGSFLVAGGEGASGPESTLEVFETSESLW